METLLSFVNDNVYYCIGAGVVVLGMTAVAYQRHKINTFTPRICGVDYPRNVIILHAFSRDKNIPNLGHFVMKLETYLRVNKLPYQADCVYKVGPKGKMPWIEYNGKTMGDSQLIIEFLEKEFKVNLNSHLSKHERATAWAIQKWIEEFTYWLNVYTRWGIHFEKFFDNIQTSIPKYARPFMKKRTTDICNKAGVGRHSDQEVSAMMVQDLRYFSEILGRKLFLMGSRISDVDCAAFGILSQVRWATPDDCPGKQLLISGELQNVTDYLDRIKTLYWPDWDELTRRKH